jgi:hypothetical protein
MLNISLYGKKRIPVGVPTLLQMLQDKNRIMMPRAVPISVIKPKHVNECVNEEKKVVVYNIGSEESADIDNIDNIDDIAEQHVVIENSYEIPDEIKVEMIDVKKEDEVVKEEQVKEEERQMEIQSKDNNKKNKRGAKGARDIRKKKK